LWPDLARAIPKNGARNTGPTKSGLRASSEPLANPYKLGELLT
jgi:hypothetical protein